jgi:hypothetical protein
MEMVSTERDGVGALVFDSPEAGTFHPVTVAPKLNGKEYKLLPSSDILAVVE